MPLLLTILAMGLVTYAIRLSLIGGLGHLELPALIRRALRFVPPAVLTAILVPELLLPGGTLDLSLGNARLLSGLLAALVAWRSRNVVLTVAAGMLALWLLEALS
ncbi:MAG: AzlD domain-containing protein [Anaerolineales bacterium]|nr:AzlD domain-containing protein [Anaerolineales bacterium]